MCTMRKLAYGDANLSATREMYVLHVEIDSSTL